MASFGIRAGACAKSRREGKADVDSMSSVAVANQACLPFTGVETQLPCRM
jgi:hypothetical protein